MRNNKILFDEVTTKILDTENSEYLKTRFYLDELPIVEEKIKFIISFLKLTRIRNFCIQILFWDSSFDRIIKTILSEEFTYIESKYNGTEIPGVCYLQIRDEGTLEKLLLFHFNFELGFEPSFNVKIYLLNIDNDSFRLVNFYDDRGFDVYWKKEN